MQSQSLVTVSWLAKSSHLPTDSTLLSASTESRSIQPCSRYPGVSFSRHSCYTEHNQHVIPKTALGTSTLVNLARSRSALQRHWAHGTPCSSTQDETRSMAAHRAPCSISMLSVKRSKHMVSILDRSLSQLF